jgi:hypothetical protein
MRSKVKIIIVAVAIAGVAGTGVVWRVEQGASGCFLCPTPPNQLEKASLVSFRFNSPTNVTLSVRNTGPLVWYLVSYRVYDGSGNQYNRTSWSGPSINPNFLGNATVTIGTSCGNNCIYQGTQGTFSQFNTGGQYTVDLRTSRDTTFTFQVTD